ncbi:MAG: SemiSWEET transporter [Acidobacteriaceae bacterium]|nr:SemiSWEET transporter [Acidobacteriaceae bacterium]
MNLSIYDLFGYTAAICNAVSFVPQLLRVYRLKSAQGVSFSTFAMYSFGSLCWVIYGVHAHSMPVLLANALTLLLSTCIAILKMRYDRREAKDLPPT